MTVPAIMMLGTSSHVGKSLLTAALCRNFALQGIRVAPFKAQNMSLNSAATNEGLEIGRAQALQAEAAGIPASVHMNPILLKPVGNSTSQVVVQGRIWGRVSAADYHRQRVAELMPFVRESYDHLASQHDLIVIEGAGSPAEINLKDNDIANMRMAEMADARCLLVGDIDRGGVFASLLGTIELLDPSERDRIRGFVINKFRGDVKLLLPGIEAIEKRLQKHCLGVVPHLADLKLDEEDSLALEGRTSHPWDADHSSSRRLRIAVVRPPSLSNFTDFDPLNAEPSVSLRFCRTADEMAHADVVILPGSKQTVDDLRWLQAQGLHHAIQHHAVGGLTIGICGGMQMLGVAIHDPQGIETQGLHSGLGLLRIETIMSKEKTTVEASGSLAQSQLFGRAVSNIPLRGYEIHVGETSYLSGSNPFSEIKRQSDDQPAVRDGCVSEDLRTFGTYLHGLFQEDEFRHAFLRAAREFHKLTEPEQLLPWKTIRQAELDRLARAVRESIDLETILSWVGISSAVRAR
jgi:adenosylcobyric acid synthase